MDRPGNATLSDIDRTEYTVATTFADITLDVATNAGKRKLEDDEVVADPEVNKP